MKHTIKVAGGALLVCLVASSAYAHPGHDMGGLAHGMAHPLSGLDHILAMTMVGIYAYQQRGTQALWLLPVTFVALMAVGGALGIAGAGLPLVEIGIGLSVVALGAALALDVKLPAMIATTVIGAFAVCHGFAHGAEMTLDASGYAYASGFMLATASLHLAGIGIGASIGRLGRRLESPLVRTAGGIASLVGVGLLAGTL
ncbi:urease accessory protein [Oleomonas cavernae]|uniref:Urease accessory protein n=1 Tax=Oleomonas cavernae TaxID=2320859 RepID=A0A418W8R1_9PROT|nr:HupE/UreJ family protein [Oleomonas cavernae]RJF86405.1 urease accessory protein [Oleomonas cavernae]